MFIGFVKMSFRLEFSDEKKIFFPLRKNNRRRMDIDLSECFIYSKKYQQQHSFKFVWLRDVFSWLPLSISLIFPFPSDDPSPMRISLKTCSWHRTSILKFGTKNIDQIADSSNVTSSKILVKSYTKSVAKIIIIDFS